MTVRRQSFSGLVAVLAGCIAGPAGPVAAETLVVEAARHHLGRPGQPEWREFATDRAEGDTLVIRFTAKPNPTDALLRLRQSNVKLDRAIRLNGRRVGRLVLDEADLIHEILVPPGAVRDGENTLEIDAAAQADDIVVSEITLEPDAAAARARRATLRVTVAEAPGGRPLPCRITIVDPRGVLVPLTGSSDRLAVRPGVAYTADGRATLALDPGHYTVHATRGFEYGHDASTVDLAPGASASIGLSLRREVPTPGLIAVDTHVHTLTYSGHGDATLDERVVTLAGEGIELPIATEHNQFISHAQAAARLGLAGAFTAVKGDEVTTARGHFNAFPMSSVDLPPDPRIASWPELMTAIRRGRTDRFVILNHPRDVHAGFRPFGPDRFNPVVGEDREGTPYQFDGLEVVNSGALQTDLMRVARDWMALWNHGQEITAIGASDSHDVSRFLVGQGRTYVSCPDDDPGHIDVAAAVRSLRAGRATVSLGLLARLAVDDRFAPGDLATGLGPNLRVTATVLGPSWVQADHVTLFANGQPIRDAKLDTAAGQPTPEKARVTWTMPRPTHDVALVLVASGPGVTAPYWAIPRPYQPASIDWTPRVFSVTNPIRVDGDANGVWNSARYYAQFLIEILGTEPKGLLRMLANYDEAVSVQTAAFLLPPGQTRFDPEFARALESAPEPVRRGFAAFEASLKRP